MGSHDLKDCRLANEAGTGIACTSGSGLRIQSGHQPNGVGGVGWISKAQHYGSEARRALTAAYPGGPTRNATSGSGTKLGCIPSASPGAPRPNFPTKPSTREPWPKGQLTPALLSPSSKDPLLESRLQPSWYQRYPECSRNSWHLENWRHARQCRQSHPHSPRFSPGHSPLRSSPTGQRPDAGFSATDPQR